MNLPRGLQTIRIPDEYVSQFLKNRVNSSLLISFVELDLALICGCYNKVEVRCWLSSSNFSLQTNHL